MIIEGLEKAPESWKDFILDVAQRATDKLGRSECPAPSGRRWFIESYLKGDVGLELVLAIHAAEPAYLRAVIVGTGVEADGFGVSDPAEMLDADNGYKQLVMLVPDVEMVEDGKFVVRWLRSLVRLHLIKEPPHIPGNTGRDVGEGNPLAIDVGFELDRELRIPVGSLPGHGNELPGEMVEGDAEIMNRIADDRTSNRLEDWYPAEPHDIFRSLLIALSDDGLLAHRVKQAGTAVKVLEMGFCPVDLGVYAL
jgi:hypothetical protein